MEEASVAGESPDRSKQRESSAEPTPGSAGSVPEARDPRLAVSREKDSSGGVDTATKILSVRDAKKPAEDGDRAADSETPDEDRALRKAVSAWVRGADATAKPPEQRQAETPEAEHADESQAPEAGQPEESAESGPEKRDADADTDTDESETDAEATAEADADAEPKGRADAGAGAGTDSEADADAEVTADADDDATGDADPSVNAKGDAGSKASADATADADAEASADADADAKSDTEADADAKSGAEADTAADANGDADSKANPDATADAGSNAGAKSDADAKADADANTDAGAKNDADADVEADAKSAADATADATKADADADAGTKADAEADAVEDAAPEAGESGAEGDGDGDGDGAEDPPEAPAAVDQPTTAFKALRPKAPQVDQPTTMLKLGGTAKAPKAPEAPESDAERTSRFVALRDDVKPAAKPTPPDVTAAVPQIGPERTAQQPLPPKPPLDLLAELTNTPPPPQTPVRTIVRRVKIWTPLVLLLAIVFAVVQTFRPLPQPTLDLTAKDNYTFTGAKVAIPWPSQGQAALDVQGIGTFGSSGDQKPVPIASVAKVMTAYIVLRDHPLKSGAAGPKLKIDKTAQQQSDAGQESTVHVTAGDSITQREALESILIASANNIARLLARWDDGSEQAFVAKMNATAKSLGMTNTTYTDPSGLTNTTVSTAVDQVKLAKAAMTMPAFREVAAMMSYNDYKGTNHSNWNHLVGHNNVVGIKTGTTTSALGNLVFAAKQQVGNETRTVVGAVVRQPADPVDHSILTGALNAADKLIRAGQAALKPATILKKGDVVGYVDDGLGGRTPVVATKDVTAAGWSGLQVKLSFAPDTVPHTAKAGTKVGTLTVGDGSAGAVSVPVALEEDLAEPGFGAKLTRLG
ncbi:D-alanyl-D-alanine carboxypeptidase [Streptomyces sp. NPDC004561]